MISAAYITLTAVVVVLAVLVFLDFRRKRFYNEYKSRRAKPDIEKHKITSNRYPY